MLPKARIPIIKLSLPPSAGQPFGLSCDIGFENRLALENTRLLLTYAMVDPRMRTIVLFCMPSVIITSHPLPGNQYRFSSLLFALQITSKSLDKTPTHQRPLPGYPEFIRLCIISDILSRERSQDACVTVRLAIIFIVRLLSLN